jgi:hypothetical protein
MHAHENQADMLSHTMTIVWKAQGMGRGGVIHVGTSRELQQDELCSLVLCVL